MNQSNPSDRPRWFRRYFVGLAAGVVLIVAFLGVVVGTTAQTEFESIRVLHVLVIRPTPLTMGALAGGIAAVMLGILFWLLRIASRYDDANEYRD